MAQDHPETDALLAAAARGEDSAHRKLLERHRERLRQMVALRLDRRLVPRVDPSDVVQETLVDAARKLEGYLRDRPLPFYPWLHRLAAERLAQTHRRHVRAQARAIGRERPMPEESSAQLVDRLVASSSSPSQRLLHNELRQRLREALGNLSANDREILMMYYLESLAFAEIAAILDITAGAAKVRHFRALERIRKLMNDDDTSGTIP